MRSYRTFRCIRFYLGALIAAKCHVIGTRLAATKSNAPILAFRLTHPVTVVVKFAVSIERTGDSTVPQGQIIFVGDCMGIVRPSRSSSRELWPGRAQPELKRPFCWRDQNETR
jgi:hypothetical protein